MTAAAAAPAVATSDVRQRCKEHALQKISDTFQGSKLTENAETFPQFAWDELNLGAVLGKGGFGTVSEIRGFKIATEESEPGGPEKEDSRSFLAAHCIREGGDCRYAVKKLSPEIVKDDGLFLKGIVDLGIETHFLSDIEHPNIVKMRGTANCGYDSEDYFIIMDRLYDTLQVRIDKWLGRAKRLKLAGKLFDRKGEKKKGLYEERIVAAYDLSDAVKYLHSRDVIYRDIKPENVAFDVRGDIKLFDFGLSKEISSLSVGEDGKYQLTAMTGSFYYMAPEVANGEPYNAKCDVYSFSILLWQMLAMQQPYEQYTPKSLRAKVYNGDHRRPKIDESWTSRVKGLLMRSWCKDIGERITMEQVSQILHQESAEIRGGNETGLEHMRRRSTFVFRT